MSQDFSKRIGNIDVNIAMGDITQTVAHAYVVPQFNIGASYDGVGGAIARSGAVKGLDDFNEYAKGSKEPLPFGHVHITEAGAGNAFLLLNAVSVASGREEEFETVHNSVYNALKASEKTGVKTIAAPAMGTGVIGRLTSEQSAKAMLSAVHRFSEEGGDIEKFDVVIFGDNQAHSDFVKVLSNDDYVNAAAEARKGQFDMDRWVSGMRKDGVDVKVPGYDLTIN